MQQMKSDVDRGGRSIEVCTCWDFLEKAAVHGCWCVFDKAPWFPAVAIFRFLSMVADIPVHTRPGDGAEKQGREHWHTGLHTGFTTQRCLAFCPNHPCCEQLGCHRSNDSAATVKSRDQTPHLCSFFSHPSPPSLLPLEPGRPQISASCRGLVGRFEYFY